MTLSRETSKLRRLPPIFSVNIARFSLLCPTQRGCLPTVEIPPRTNYDIAAIVFRKKKNGGTPYGIPPPSVTTRSCFWG
jgi:hypothetical protein